jgi:tetratricopeptide (TPR) repeat protein
MEPPTGPFEPEDRSPDVWRIGDRLQAHLEIRDILRGGMGVVLIVQNAEGQTDYAVKTFPGEAFARNPAVARRFTDEALLWVNLGHHPNIVQAHYLINIREKPYLFLDYVPGGDLRAWIADGRTTGDLTRTLQFALQFCDAMTYAASQGIKVHRDIKPSNCLVTADGVLQLTDFGLAKALEDAGPPGSGGSPEEAGADDSMTRSGQGMGTPTHMAPEQFEDAKHVDVRSDVYSFGVMLFQMVAGRLPFRGGSWQEYRRLHATQPPPELPTGCPELGDLVRTCLSKDPACRFQDFSAVRDRLASLYTQLTHEPAPQAAAGTELDAVDWLHRGLSLNELGLPGQALACYDRALEIRPDFELAWLNRGNPLAKLGRHEEAIACYDRALAINPDRAEPWMSKGNRLSALGRYDEAIVCYDHALAMDAKLYQAWEGKGLALRGREDSVGAIRCFEEAITLRPGSVTSWFNIVAALSSIGKDDAALACCDRALRLIPVSRILWTKKAQLLSLVPGRTHEALACYDRAIEINPNAAEAWLGKGLCLVSAQQVVQGLECLQKARELGDHSADQVIEELTAAREPGADDDQLGLSLALAYFFQARGTAADPRRAQEFAGKAIEMASRWPDAWVSKAIRIHAYGWFFYDPGAALAVLGGAEQFERALAPDCVEKHFTKGLGTLCGMKYEEALQSFRDAARWQPDSPFIDLCIAIALIEQGAPGAPAAVDRYKGRHGSHPLSRVIKLDGLLIKYGLARAVTEPTGSRLPGPAKQGNQFQLLLSRSWKFLHRMWRKGSPLIL